MSRISTTRCDTCSHDMETRGGAWLHLLAKKSHGSDLDLDICGDCQAEIVRVLPCFGDFLRRLREPPTGPQSRGLREILYRQGLSTKGEGGKPE